MLDDGTGEAHVWVSGALVRPLLGLNDRQWEGLQRALRLRGQVEVYPWGQNLVRAPSCVTPQHQHVCSCVCVFQVCADALLHFLLCVCSSKVVCRQLALTCRRHNRQRSEGNDGTQTPTRFARCHGDDAPVVYISLMTSQVTSPLLGSDVPLLSTRGSSNL